MKFKDYLDYELNTKSNMELRDVIKMCYQAAFGAEHLLTDLERACAYFEEEFASIEERDVPLYEYISEDVARVDLGAWKASGMPKEWLFDLFVMATKESYGGEKQMLENIKNLHGKTCLIVTHREAALSIADRTLFVQCGLIK